ncbi:MAG: 3,4-dihydroxy-2-butanone-4-phosphate synthase [Bacteroidetes bacterium]|nr:3,4-dihydroxy-2-butanone-4-phosphate synthase [Bacteroidota bacterium]
MNSTDQVLKLNTIEEAITDIKAGKIIIVVDDEDRENEGDFICAAECITPEIINFMATHGRGLICAPIDENRADELDLKMMVSDNTALHETAFTVSIDLIGHGCTTGISAYDRAQCIKALVNPDAKSTDFARPGHIFPLRAKSGGVLRRTGHTEAAIDLARMAGYYPAGVLVEILNEDGSMARLPQLVEIAQKHDLKVITIKDLVAYRMMNERIVKRELSAKSDTPFGEFEFIAYKQLTTGDTHLAIRKGTWSADEPVMVRVHSASETDDILGVLFDSPKDTIKESLELIAKEGKGLLLYMRHGEKVNPILNKIREMRKEKTEEPEEFQSDREQRDFGVGAQILRDQSVRKMRLITSNPKRRIGLLGYGLEIVETIAFNEKG